VSEAVSWHGGEGAASKALYESLSPAQRAALLQFIQAL
jgi:CxxC motif-containing protein (DUF1111 family)